MIDWAFFGTKRYGDISQRIVSVQFLYHHTTLSQHASQSATPEFILGQGWC
jgi:hypothetical protein